MSAGWSLRRIDLGRLAIAPIFSLFLIVNIAALARQLVLARSADVTTIAAVSHNTLVVCLYALFVVFYLIRRSARSTTDSFAAKSIAVAATFLPFSIPALGRPTDHTGILLLADAITAAGMIIAIASVAALGRSIGIIPQARELVRTGPYRFVRHPLYLGELIAILGIVIARFSLMTAVVYCLLAAAQVYRAVEEEKILAAAFPEYAAYLAGRARFIPALF